MVNVDNRGNPRDPKGSSNTLYFIVGALVIAVLIIGWFIYGRDNGRHDRDGHEYGEHDHDAGAGGDDEPGTRDARARSSRHAGTGSRDTACEHHRADTSGRACAADSAGQRACSGNAPG